MHVGQDKQLIHRKIVLTFFHYQSKLVWVLLSTNNIDFVVKNKKIYLESKPFVEAGVYV